MLFERHKNALRKIGRALLQIGLDDQEAMELLKEAIELLKDSNTDG